MNLEDNGGQYPPYKAAVSGDSKYNRVEIGREQERAPTVSVGVHWEAQESGDFIMLILEDNGGEWPPYETYAYNRVPVPNIGICASHLSDRRKKGWWAVPTLQDTYVQPSSRAGN